jgi:hypothetical protein
MEARVSYPERFAVPESTLKRIQRTDSTTGGEERSSRIETTRFDPAHRLSGNLERVVRHVSDYFDDGRVFSPDGNSASSDSIRSDANFNNASRDSTVSVPDVADAEAQAEPWLVRQAEQLAEYLQTRQEELDRREAQINARTSFIEETERRVRLWIREEQLRFDQQSQALTTNRQLLERERAQLDWLLKSFSAS